VPAAPSANIVNIAKALIGNRHINIVEVGIRPGEKLHETLVAEEEALHAVQRGKYFAVRPMLPELQTTAGFKGEPRPLSKAYTSEDSVLDLQGTTDILERHDLMPGRAKLAEGGELSPLVRSCRCSASN
jgi:FlaA1/EpsC-like NDP-sugar epimerase